MSIRRLLGACACLTATLTPHSAAAAEEGGRVIEEILVTAEKREASAQDTPIAITTFTQAGLDLRGIEEIEDLQFATPNLVISQNSQSPVTYAYIRGIGSDQLVAGFDPGVAYHVDGIYVGQPSSMPVDLWDMERVEVLRGPQGTLYGRNTTGGSINVITANPSDVYEASTDLTLGTYDRYRVRGAVSGPLGENVSGRIAAITEEADGFQQNYVGHDADGTDHWAVRGKLAFDLSDTAELVLSAQRFENNGNLAQKRKEPFGPVELAPGFIINVYEGAIANPEDPRKVAKDFNEQLDLENTLLSANLKLDLGFASLVSITGYIENSWYQAMDIDMSSNPVQFQTWSMETTQATQEFQLVSNSEGPWTWIVGAFYFNENLDTDYYFEDSSIAGFQFYNGGNIDTESMAFYGQASYDMRDNGAPFRFTAGARYTQDDKEIGEYQQIPQFGVDFSGQFCPICFSDKSWDEWTGKLGVDWFVTEDVMAYGSYSHGYKGGGFSIGQFDSYDPEKVDAFELGVKSTLLDGRAQVNLSTFYYDYQDLQVNYLVFTLFTTDNAAEATITGVELEATFIPIDAVTIAANVNWLNAEFDEYDFTPTIDLSGDTMNRAPEYSASLSAQYDWLLGASGMYSMRLDYYWQDEMYLRVQNVPRHEVDAYDTLDARFFWTSDDARWIYEVFGKNLTDEDNIRGMTVSDGLSTGNNTFLSYFPPRTYGMRLAYSVGG